mmetsp:Transcript_32401/g.67580  ORF Transcript_32401/g.67580 Transcript_32401/m.67580 type:complete len:214 (+) Transcript_32401:1496-2137(+)
MKGMRITNITTDTTHSCLFQFLNGSFHIFLHLLWLIAVDFSFDVVVFIKVPFNVFVPSDFLGHTNIVFSVRAGPIFIRIAIPKLRPVFVHSPICLFETKFRCRVSSLGRHPSLDGLKGPTFHFQNGRVRQERGWFTGISSGSGIFIVTTNDSNLFSRTKLVDILHGLSDALRVLFGVGFQICRHGIFSSLNQRSSGFSGDLRFCFSDTHGVVL